jgi:hypothetical protein
MATQIFSNNTNHIVKHYISVYCCLFMVIVAIIRKMLKPRKSEGANQHQRLNPPFYRTSVTPPRPAPPQTCICWMTDTMTAQRYTSIGPAAVRWDTDSYPIKVDNCCTRSISFDINDFDPDTLVPTSDLSVSGFVGDANTPILQMVTIVWHIVDDQDENQTIRIPNSYYVPGGRSRILSPQHWAQESEDNAPIPYGTQCVTTSDAVVLKWNQLKHTKTIPIDPTGNNVGTMWTVPGYRTAEQVAYHVEKYYGNISFDSEVSDALIHYLSYQCSAL